MELGYFIQSNRVFFLGEKDWEELRTALDGPSLGVAITLLRKLRIEGRLLSAYGEIAQQLQRAAIPASAYQTLFVGELYPYQREGVDWLCFCVRHGIGTILADDMGLGKTAQLIATICDTLAREPESTILVVVPNPRIDNWCRELSYFAPAVFPYVHYGSGRTGLSADLARHQVVITPYPTLTADISMISEIPFRMAVFDEASMVKNAKSGRTVAAFLVVAEVKIAVTGTPVENSLLGHLDNFRTCIAWLSLGSLESFTRQYIGKGIQETLSRDLGGAGREPAANHIAADEKRRAEAAARPARHPFSCNHAGAREGGIRRDHYYHSR